MEQENISSSSSSYDMFSSVNNMSSSSDVKLLLVDISEIIELSIMTQNYNIIKIGCYFYRVSSVIMELESSENTQTNPAEILLSLSDCVYIAKDLFSSITIPYSEVETTMKQLESVIKHMGEVLNSITSSEEECFHHAVQSLAKDINDFTFETSEEIHHVQKEDDLYNINNLESSTDDEEPETTQVMSYIEPLYETFYCPLTNKILKDPVTIETGVTYERIAITEWFKKFSNPADIVCPKTGVKINSLILNENIALRDTIKQWEERNEQATIKAAKSALSLASSKPKILEALHNLQILCRKHQYVMEIRSIGIIPLLAAILKHEDRDLTIGTLDLLRKLTQNDDEDEGKKMIATTVDLSRIIHHLTSEVEYIKHSALLLLVELSKSSYFCDKIGSVTGGVLMLVTLKYRQPVDAFVSEKVDEILKNLERIPSNIKIMAENGYWQPLLHHFLEGNEEMKVEMGGYLGEIFLGHDDEIKGYVLETVSPVLIQMVFHGNSLARNVAFKALKQISSHPENGKILARSGIASNMLDVMLKRTVYNEPMNLKAEAAAILANILESGSVQLTDLQTDNKLSLDYIIFFMIKRVRNSTPDDLNINFVRMLLCLMKFSKTQDIIVSVVEESDACANIIELLNNPNEELQVVSIMFSIALSPFFGNMLADRLCKTRGQPQALLKELQETTASPTEKQAVSVSFLAKLPHENLSLNLALSNSVPLVLRKLDQVQRSGARMTKYGRIYLEGLVGILVRFTSTLHDHQFLVVARTFSFTTVFTELLMNTFSDEVQKLSANGLENLSSKTVTLSKPSQIKKLKSKKFYLQKCFSFDLRTLEKPPPPPCPVHKGACSSQETFCLVEAKAVEKLLTCFDHNNIQVVEAALSAICTLLDERVDLESSVSILLQEKVIQHLLNVIKAHKDESLRQKTFWILEKLLMEGNVDSTSEISQDRFLRATLINVLHYGNGDIRLMAEKILRHLV